MPKGKILMGKKSPAPKGATGDLYSTVTGKTKGANRPQLDKMGPSRASTNEGRFYDSKNPDRTSIKGLTEREIGQQNAILAYAINKGYKLKISDLRKSEYARIGRGKRIGGK